MKIVKTSTAQVPYIYKAKNDPQGKPKLWTNGKLTDYELITITATILSVTATTKVGTAYIFDAIPFMEDRLKIEFS